MEPHNAMEPHDADRRTTPRALQPVALAFLVVLGVYHLAAFHFALSDKGTWWLYPGTWQMFTLIDRNSEIVEGEAFYDGGWHAFDPQELFPYEWESGPRYARSSFYNSRHRMTIMAESTCQRFDRPVERVRYRLVSWRRRLGRLERPKRINEKELVSWRCGGDVRLPRGRRL